MPEFYINIQFQKYNCSPNRLPSVNEVDTVDLTRFGGLAESTVGFSGMPILLLISSEKQCSEIIILHSYHVI